MTATQDSRARPASGIPIVPEQLTRWRDALPLSRQGLAERAGEILFDRDRFAEVLSGRVQPDAQLARALWLALDCEPAGIIRGLPPGLPRADVPLWLRRNTGWTLDLDAVKQARKQRSRLDGDRIRSWTDGDLAAAVSRHWYSRDMVNKIETGERRPSADALDAFCQVLGCEPADLKDDAPELPDGATKAHRDLLDYNKRMRDWADARGISYRGPGGRIKYPQKLREAYAEHLAGAQDLAGQDGGVRRGIRVRDPAPLNPVSVMAKPPPRPRRAAKP